MGGKLILLFLLLVSLCTSRAEGVHLLPFADLAEPQQSEALKGGRRPFYQLSRTPKDPISAIADAITPDGEPAPILFSSFEFEAAPVLFAASPVAHDHKTQSLPVRWPNLLSSSSDRSPPTA